MIGWLAAWFADSARGSQTEGRLADLLADRLADRLDGSRLLRLLAGSGRLPQSCELFAQTHVTTA